MLLATLWVAHPLKIGWATLRSMADTDNDADNFEEFVTDASERVELRKEQCEHVNRITKKKRQEVIDMYKLF